MSTAKDILRRSPAVVAHDGADAVQAFVGRVRVIRLVVVAIFAALSFARPTFAEAALWPLALAFVVANALAITLGRVRFAAPILLALLPAIGALLVGGVERRLGELPLLAERATGAAVVCAVILAIADGVALAVSRPLASLIAAVIVGVCLPAASVFVPSAEGLFTPTGAALGAMLATSLVVGARAAEHLAPTRFARGDTAAAALLGVVALPAALVQTLVEDETPDARLDRSHSPST